MANTFLVTYDIRDPKRLKQVFRVMSGFGDHLQLSVFRCELSGSTLARMKLALVGAIHHRDDQVLIFDLGPSDGFRASQVESLGQAYCVSDRDAVII